LQEVQHIELDGVTGNITGDFTLTFGGMATLPIQASVNTPSGCPGIAAGVTDALQRVQSVQNVSVPSLPYKNFGCQLNVTFIGIAGDLPLLTVSTVSNFATSSIIATATLASAVGGTLTTTASKVTITPLRTGDAVVLGGDFTVGFRG